MRQASSSTKRSSYDSEKIRNDIAGRRAWLTPERSLYDNESSGGGSSAGGPLMTVHRGRGMMNGRRGRFIVLGSSGECLPVSRRHHVLDSSGSLYSSCDDLDKFEDTTDDEDDDEVFLSARESLETEGERIFDLSSYTRPSRINERTSTQSAATNTTHRWPSTTPAN